MGKTSKKTKTAMKAVATVGGMSPVPINKCKLHPRYMGVHAPRRTDKFEEGCPDCWEYFKALSERTESYPDLYVKRVGGSLRAFETPRDLAECGLEYFEWCVRNEKVPTKTGLAVFVGVGSSTVRKYRSGDYDADKEGNEHKPSYSAVLKRIDDVIISGIEHTLLTSKSNPTGAIAWLNNNAGWSQNERKQIDLGVEIRVVDYSGGPWRKAKVTELHEIAEERAGDPPDVGTVDVDAAQVDAD